MTTLMVWYFLTSSVAVSGPFTTREQCQKFAEWAYKFRYTSECWEAPLAQIGRAPIDVSSGKTTHQE